jgi:hypothetical protein
VDPTRPDAEVPDPANPGKVIKAPMQVDVTQMDALLDSLVQVRKEFSPARRTLALSLCALCCMSSWRLRRARRERHLVACTTL